MSIDAVEIIFVSLLVTAAAAMAGFAGFAAYKLIKGQR